MDHHSGTVISSKANIWYIPYNMYLIYRVDIYIADNINITD